MKFKIEYFISPNESFGLCKTLVVFFQTGFQFILSRLQEKEENENRMIDEKK